MPLSILAYVYIWYLLSDTLCVSSLPRLPRRTWRMGSNFSSVTWVFGSKISGFPLGFRLNLPKEFQGFLRFGGESKLRRKIVLVHFFSGNFRSFLNSA